MSDQSDAFNRLAIERGIIIAPPRELPKIPLPRNGFLLSDFAREVGKVVGANGLFRRDCTPVTINPETGRIQPMEADRFRSYVESHLLPYVDRGGWKMDTSMTTHEAPGVLEADEFCFPLRKLRRVHQVRLPVLRKDGRIELLPKGYDAESSFFTMKDALDYPTDWPLERGVLYLQDLLREFPFADARARAAHIVAMVSMFAGTLLPAKVKSMNFLYRANMARSGKGLLVATAIAGPWGAVEVQSIAGANPEFRKVLDTEALNGSAYIFFDEVESKLVNRALNAFLTANVWSGRLMNSQQRFAVPQNSVVFLSGNGVELSPDLAGRCLLIDLHVNEADAQARKIERVISDQWLTREEVRSDLLASLWALVNSWNEKRRPRPSSIYRGFEVFSETIGGIVEHAGFYNPLQSAAAEVDAEYADMLAIVEQLARGVRARTELDFDDLIAACREVGAFEWELQVGNNSQELTPRARSFFGKLFSIRFGGTIFTLADGRRVQFGKRGKNRQRRYTLGVIGAH